MERVATDVAKPPIPGGDLPSFEELLAKGSFHARLAQARLKREKLLAESDAEEGFILDTSRKPWDRAAPRSAKRDAMTAALGMSVAVGAAPARPDSAPGPAAPAGPDSRRASAKVVPIRRGEVFRPDAPAAAAVGAPMPAPDLHARGIAEAAATPATAAVSTGSRAGWRAMMAGGGFLCGLAIGAAMMATLPQRGERPRLSPATAAIATDAGALPEAKAAAIAVAATPVALPAAPDTAADSRRIGPAPITVPAARPRPASGMALAGAPDAPPAAHAVPAVPAGPGTAPGLALPDATVADATVAAGPGVLPLPDVQPGGLAGVTLLAAVAAHDAPVAGQGNPPPAAPLPATSLPVGPVIVNAPESVAGADLAGIVEGLAAAGFALSGPNRVDIPISESNVRFFHPADAAAAQALAGRIGARLRDFTDFSPAPPAGTIEVWLAGRGNAPATTRRASGQRAMTAEQRELNVLRNRILRQLRNGEHL